MERNAKSKQNRFRCCWKSSAVEDNGRSTEAGNEYRQRDPDAPRSSTSHRQPPPTSRDIGGKKKSWKPTKKLQIKGSRDKEQEGNLHRMMTSQESLSSRESTYEASCPFERKMKEMQRIMKRRPKKKLKVGIFSRSAEYEYQWLKSKLESEYFKKVVEIVKPCQISNNGYQQFHEDLSWCKFGILYHSKNRGRLNITDVTDSLYNEELKELSEKLEKKNVIVVIDDLTDSSDERKDSILKNQPSLGKLAEEVFLFSTDEKKPENRR